jgi:hypothetical protein
MQNDPALTAEANQGVAGGGGMSSGGVPEEAPPFAPEGSASEQVLPGDVRPQVDHDPGPAQDDRQLVEGEGATEAPSWTWASSNTKAWK